MSKIIAYCKIGCPHSEATKRFLTESNRSCADEVEIIEVRADHSTVQTIGNQSFNISKDDFFNYVAQKEGVKLNGHHTFPVNIFISSKNTKCFIGGNNELQGIYRTAERTSDVSTLQPHSSCLMEATHLATNDQRRLYCHFLKVLNKIKK
jgi:hypothetical protein